MTSYYAYDAGLPCRNPNCKSRGKPHPNCHCWAGSERSSNYEYSYARGGEVGEEPFCSKLQAHFKDCPLYEEPAPSGVAMYDEGGQVQPPMAAAQAPQDDVPATLGMASVHHGLLGMLTDVGHSKLAEPDKHIKKIRDLQDKSKNHAEDIHEHPLSGSASKANLVPIMGRLSGPMNNLERNPEALRSSIDYLNASIKGHDKLDNHLEGLLGHGKGTEAEEDKETREKLKEHLKELKEDPNKMLEVGGSLGHYLPEHGAGLAYQAAVATKYLDSLKPQAQQLSPLDTVEQEGKEEKAQYDRQLDIAQNPLLILKHVKDGTLQPMDMKTVQTIYPGLEKIMTQKATERLIEAKANNTEIPYRQKMALSMLLSQPLDFTQTPMAAQAIMASASLPQPQSQQKKGKSGATAAELKQINKVDELYETPLEARQINRNRH